MQIVILLFSFTFSNFLWIWRFSSSKYFMVLIDTSRGLRQQIYFAVMFSVTQGSLNFHLQCTFRRGETVVKISNTSTTTQVQVKRCWQTNSQKVELRTSKYNHKRYIYLLCGRYTSKYVIFFKEVWQWQIKISSALRWSRNWCIVYKKALYVPCVLINE